MVTVLPVLFLPSNIVFSVYCTCFFLCFLSLLWFLLFSFELFRSLFSPSVLEDTWLFFFSVLFPIHVLCFILLSSNTSASKILHVLLCVSFSLPSRCILETNLGFLDTVWVVPASVFPWENLGSLDGSWLSLNSLLILWTYHLLLRLECVS